MIETGLTTNAVLSSLMRSPHGDFDQYVPTGSRAAKELPEFLAHLISYNRDNSQIRDVKTSLPVIMLAHGPDVFVENALAHLAILVPRELLRAYRFAKQIKIPGRGMSLRRLIEAYLRHKETHWSNWERTVIHHRKTMVELYSLLRVKPSDMAKQILFDHNYPPGSVFAKIRDLKTMSAAEAAGTVIEYKLPSLVVLGAFGDRIKKDSDLAMALIERMSGPELVNNSALLEKAGIKTIPAVRAAYEKALMKAGSSKKSTFKAIKAIEAVEDESIKEKLRNVQEKAIQTLGGVDGNWLVLGDKSGSMNQAIEASRHIAATLAKMVKGQVNLIFFDSTPRLHRVSGKTYDQILQETKLVNAAGGTSVGCGMRHALDAMLEVDGIAVVSDGGENTPPMFADTYQRYCKKFDKEPTVYFFHLDGEGDAFGPNLKRAGIDYQEFDLRGGKIDYYALPALCQSLNTKRYDLVQKIMDTKLLSLEEVWDGAQYHSRRNRVGNRV